MIRETACLGCGVRLVLKERPFGRGNYAKRCNECRQKWHRQRVQQYAANRKYACAACGKPTFGKTCKACRLVSKASRLICACGAKKSKVGKVCLQCEFERKRSGRPVVRCAQCGIEFKRKQWKRDSLKYCSRECAFANPEWKAALLKRGKDGLKRRLSDKLGLVGRELEELLEVTALWRELDKARKTFNQEGFVGAASNAGEGVNT